MADFLPLVGRDIIVLNMEEGNGAIDMFCAGLCAGTDALAESAEFVCIRRVPRGLVPGVTAGWQCSRNSPVAGLSTDRAAGLSTLVKALQRYAKPSTSLGVMANDLQSPANPSCSTGARMDFAVGI